jgi:aminopeptidase
MGGAAVTLATFQAAVKLGLNVNVSAFIPLCENMPSGRATKPGDVVTASNGRTIEIINTDAEGRLILADAIWYAVDSCHPKRLIDIATLTGAMDVALGSAHAGVFCNSDDMFEDLRKTSTAVNEGLWRMPLSNVYRKQIRSHVADIKNVGNRSAGSCTAAVFLEEFLTKAKTKEDGETDGEYVDSQRDLVTPAWAHIDMTGVMQSSATDGYDVKGMSGRPVRALIAYLQHLSDMSKQSSS